MRLHTRTLITIPKVPKCPGMYLIFVIYDGGVYVQMILRIYIPSHGVVLYVERQRNC